MASAPALAFAHAQTQAAPVPITFARLPFRGFKIEGDSVLHTPQHENPKSSSIIRAWERFRVSSVRFKLVDDIYSDALRLVSGINCSARELCEFVLLLSKFDTYPGFSLGAGVFLSALINAGSDRDYTVPADSIGTTLNFLGCSNVKDLTIVGNVGNYIGYGMKDGNLVVIGNAGTHAGMSMTGGLLTIEHDADILAGVLMSGGEIRIKGKLKPHQTVRFSGQVFVGGRRIFPREGVL